MTATLEKQRRANASRAPGGSVATTAGNQLEGRRFKPVQSPGNHHQ
eukprot:CAMPEP_0204344746 /NCGR_PEP_ID=MMETSP0469-20131031/25849_1 /ASSEMBLY_ACC=CAM_ASM_000384 /TAXON_ID=2969 /ORGANISM="Oxyrrhis marina" /LENGTH=45 /DNA_ID= /DNA_START= /DNA_END= /DNA_ORIENTATION=